MKYCSMRIFLAVAVTVAILPLYESGAAFDSSIIRTESANKSDRSSGRTYIEIKPTFAYRLAYEDNIDGGNNGGNRLSDWSNHYRPQVDITGFSPLFSLNSHVGLDIAEYMTERDYNHVNQDYTVSLGYVPSERLECSFGAGYAVSFNNKRYEDIGAIDPTTVYQSEKTTTTDFNGGFSYILTPRSSIGLTGTFTDYTSIATDGSQFYGLIGYYAYSLSPRTNLVFNANYFYYNFKGNNDTLTTPDGSINPGYANYNYEINNYSIMGGVEHNFENDGKLLAQAGLRYSENDSSQRTDIGTKNTSGNGTGWVGVLEYQKRFNEFLFGFTAQQDVAVSPEGANYQSTSFLSRTSYRFTQRLNAGLDFRFIRAYADSSNNEFVGSGRDSRTYIVQPQLIYMAYRWLQTTAGYQFRYTQDKETNASNSHANLFFIELRFTPLRNLVLR